MEPTSALEELRISLRGDHSPKMMRVRVLLAYLDGRLIGEGDMRKDIEAFLTTGCGRAFLDEE